VEKIERRYGKERTLSPGEEGEGGADSKPRGSAEAIRFLPSINNECRLGGGQGISARLEQKGDGRTAARGEVFGVFLYIPPKDGA